MLPYSDRWQIYYLQQVANLLFLILLFARLDILLSAL